MAPYLKTIRDNNECVKDDLIAWWQLLQENTRTVHKDGA